MKLLKEIQDKPISFETNPKIRDACRAVIFDNDGRIPLLFVSKFKYHKIPGGGIEKGEDKTQALERELIEEAGSGIEIKGEIGKISEYRSRWNLLQMSYCYVGQVTTKGEPNFTEKEKDQGFKLIWLTLNEAITSLKNDKPTNYEGKFIQERDLRFLQEAKKIQG